MDFLGAFAKSRKENLASPYPSVCSRGIARLQIKGLSWNFIFEYFSKICWENTPFIKSYQEL